MAHASTSHAAPTMSTIDSGLFELQRHMFVRSVLLLGALCICWQYALIFLTPALLKQGSATILAVTAVTCVAAWRMSARHATFALAIWQVGYVIVVALSAVMLNVPSLVMLVTTTPVVALLMGRWLEAMGGATLALAAIFVLGAWPYAGFVLPSYIFWLTALMLTIAIPIVSQQRSARMLVVWYQQSYMQTEIKIQEALDQRQHLQLVQQDLVQANRELTWMTRRLEGLTRAAEEARQAKERFVATVSHELRTPLNMIIGFSEIIAQSPRVYGVNLPPTLLADVASIRRNSEHLLALVSDVLDLSQVDLGKLSIRRDWVAASALVEAAVQAVQPLFTAKGLFLRREQIEKEIQLSCDGTRIREVLINLLSNAGRFTETGGVVVRVWSEDHNVVFAVEDTGPGLSPEAQQRIFEPFQQIVENARSSKGGSGLGLTISKDLVEMHGGVMWLESTPGAGSTFLFRLPLRDPAELAVGTTEARRWFNPFFQYEARTRPSLAPVVAQSCGSYVVLDEPDGMLARLLARYITEVEVRTVDSLGEARETLERRPAEVLLVNEAAVSMEEKLTMAHLPAGTLVIGCRLPGARTAAAELGAVRYLIKPVNRDTLLDALEQLGSDLTEVLLVDDNPEVLQLFARILSSAERPYRVLRATDGEQAMNMLRTRRPDVMILDLVMPNLSGLEVLRIKAQDPALAEIPVLVVTSASPTDTPVISDLLTVTRPGGFSLRDLLACVTALASLNASRH